MHKAVIFTVQITNDYLAILRTQIQHDSVSTVCTCSIANEWVTIMAFMSLKNRFWLRSRVYSCQKPVFDFCNTIQTYLEGILKIYFSHTSYTQIWGIFVCALDYIKGLPPVEELDLKVKLLSLCFFIAITSAHRLKRWYLNLVSTWVQQYLHFA